MTRTKRALVGAVMLLLLGGSGMALAACGSSGSNAGATSTTSTTSTDTPFASTDTTSTDTTSTGTTSTPSGLDADLTAFNSQWSQQVQTQTQAYGGSDCAIGQAADFPDEILISVIYNTGAWFQWAYKGGQNLPAATREGSDYTVDLPGGQDWQTFKAKGFPCTVNSDGTISGG